MCLQGVTHRQLPREGSLEPTEGIPPGAAFRWRGAQTRWSKVLSLCHPCRCCLGGATGNTPNSRRQPSPQTAAHCGPATIGGTQLTHTHHCSTRLTHSHVTRKASHTDSPAHLAVPSATFPGPDVLRIGPQRHWSEGSAGKIRSHGAQDHKEQGFGRLLDSERWL